MRHCLLNFSYRRFLLLGLWLGVIGCYSFADETPNSDGSSKSSISNLEQVCDAGNAAAACVSNKPRCDELDLKDEDEEYCLQTASMGKCSVEGEESETLKLRCPKACRTCWSCDNVAGNEQCKVWADSGECNVNPRYMLVYCAKACNICHYQGDLAQLMHDRLVEKKLEEEKALQLQKTQYGMEQTITDEASQKTYDAMIDYMQNVVAVDPKFERVRDECKMRSENCVFWASIGECNKTREYMIVQCAPACQTCEMLDFSNRCPYDPQEPTALQPGDLHAFFERLVLRQEYNPTILSQPEPTSPDILEGPWVVTLDQFLTDEECDRLIQMGQEVGYLESADVGKQKFDGSYDKKVNTGRTSTNAWCQNDCEADPHTAAVIQRMEDITGIPSPNFEFLQLLKYEVGQYYQQHHDYIEFHTERRQGVRTLTIFLYLNDVEEGGGTNFPLMGNLTVLPKKGRALIWPSVLNDDPNAKDNRTEHQALPVERGVKYGANAWIHQRDFKEPYARACI